MNCKPLRLRQLDDLDALTTWFLQWCRYYPHHLRGVSEDCETTSQVSLSLPCSKWNLVFLKALMMETIKGEHQIPMFSALLRHISMSPWPRKIRFPSEASFSICDLASIFPEVPRGRLEKYFPHPSFAAHWDILPVSLSTLMACTHWAYRQYVVQDATRRLSRLLRNVVGCKHRFYYAESTPTTLFERDIWPFWINRRRCKKLLRRFIPICTGTWRLIQAHLHIGDFKQANRSKARHPLMTRRHKTVLGYIMFTASLAPQAPVAVPEHHRKYLNFRQWQR